MKKKSKIIIAVIILLVLLIPVPTRYKDGGRAESYCNDSGCRESTSEKSGFKKIYGQRRKNVSQRCTGICEGAEK